MTLTRACARFTDSLLVPLPEINTVPPEFFEDPLSHGFTALKLHLREVWMIQFKTRATNVAVTLLRYEVRQS